MKAIFLFLSIHLFISLSAAQTNGSKLIRKTGMPVACGNSFAVTAGDKIYLVGGDHSSGALQIYSPGENRWETGTPFPGNIRAVYGSWYSDDTIFSVFLTEESGQMSKYVIASYGIQSNTWDKTDSLYTTVIDPAVAFVEKNIYIMGGYYIKDYSNSDSVKIYIRNQKEWTEGPELPSKRHAASAFTVGSEIYVFGGICYCNEANSILQILDTQQNSWTYKTIQTRGEVAKARGGFISGNLYLLSRHVDPVSGTVDYSNMMIYNPENDNISFDSPVQMARDEHAVTVFNDTIYIFGGSVYDPATNQRSYLNEVYAYIPGQFSGVNEQAETTFEVYPNPVSTTLNIKKNREDVHLIVRIRNMSGTLLCEKKEFSGSVIDVSCFGKGEYILEILSEDNLYINKIVII